MEVRLALSNYELINQNITEGGDHLAGTYSMSYSALAIKEGSNDSHTVSDDFTISFSKQNKTKGVNLALIMQFQLMALSLAGELEIKQKQPPHRFSGLEC